MRELRRFTGNHYPPLVAPRHQTIEDYACDHVTGARTSGYRVGAAPARPGLVRRVESASAQKQKMVVGKRWLMLLRT